MACGGGAGGACVLLMAKHPSGGHVKTRLAADVGQQAAEDLHRAFVRLELRTVSSLDVDRRVCVEPLPPSEELRRWLGGDHQAAPQRGDGLGDRLHAALEDALSGGYGKAIALASDVPDLPAWHLSQAVRALDTHDTVLGPSADGGYNYIGFRAGTLTRAAFDGVRMGTGAALSDTMLRLEAGGRRALLMPPWPDVDDRRGLQALWWRLEGARRRGRTPEGAGGLLDLLGALAPSWRRDTLSVIIPALHEAEGIGRLLAHLRSMACPVDLEPVVVDGAPERDTLAAMGDPGALAVPSPRGRARQMNAGAAAASGDVLLFLHADTLLPEGGLADAWSMASTGRCQVGAFRHGFDDERPLHDLVSRINDLRAQGMRAPWGDQAIFARRDAFEALGGYPEVEVMEDIALMAEVRRARMRVAFVPKRVRTSTRRFDAEGGILLGVARDLAIVTLYWLGAPQGALTALYRYPHGRPPRQ